MILPRRRTAIALALILLTTTAYGPCSNSSRIREAAKASIRQYFSKLTMRRFVAVGTVASNVNVSFVVPENAVTRLNSIDPSQ